MALVKLPLLLILAPSKYPHIKRSRQADVALLCSSTLPPPRMKASTKNFNPSPEDMELVSVLMSMKASARLQRNSPVSIRPTTRDIHPPAVAANQLPPSILQYDGTDIPFNQVSYNSQRFPSAASSSVLPTFRPGKALSSDLSLKSIENVQEPVPYTPEQRRRAVQRYRNKKHRRMHSKPVIRYEIRKRLADTRPRHRGRFFKSTNNIRKGK